MKTDKEKFISFMRKQGFSIFSDFMGTMSLIPSHLKTLKGNHVLIHNLTFTIFDGSDTIKGELGCVCFYYGGVKRKKYYKESRQAEILKKVFCPNSLEEAKEIFTQWQKDSAKVKSSWQKIL